MLKKYFVPLWFHLVRTVAVALGKITPRLVPLQPKI
jgi:hypothetical protein